MKYVPDSNKLVQQKSLVLTLSLFLEWEISPGSMQSIQIFFLYIGLHSQCNFSCMIKPSYFYYRQDKELCASSFFLVSFQTCLFNSERFRPRGNFCLNGLFFVLFWFYFLYVCLNGLYGTEPSVKIGAHQKSSANSFSNYETTPLHLRL